jgi:hypothetical protein
MTLFTKTDCRLCDLLKRKFDLTALQVKVEVLDGNDAGALAHLAWHGLVETARKSLPLLVLDDSSAVAEFGQIEGQLLGRAKAVGIDCLQPGTAAAPSCGPGGCAL